MKNHNRIRKDPVIARQKCYEALDYFFMQTLKDPGCLAVLETFFKEMMSKYV